MTLFDSVPRRGLHTQDLAIGKGAGVSASADVCNGIFIVAHTPIVAPTKKHQLGKLANMAQKDRKKRTTDEDRWDSLKHLGACYGKPELTPIFFGESGLDQPEAKKICASCVIRSDCLGLHLTEPFGVWGGVSARERVKIRRRLGKSRI